MNSYSRWTAAICTLIFLTTSACEHNGPDPVVESNYPVNIGEIVMASCATSGCHVAPNPPVDLNLSTWTGAMAGSDFGAVLIPGSPEWSHFIQHINTFDDLGVRAAPVMPPESTAAPLSREAVESVKAWIENGAPNVDGTTRWAEQETRSSGKLFTLCQGNDLIAVTDLETNLVMRMVSVGQIDGQVEAPHFLRMSPDKQFLYLTLIGGTAVEKYRTDTYELVGRVEVDSDPALIQLNASGTRAVISHYNSSTTPLSRLTMLNLEDMSIVDEVIATSDLLASGHGMAANSDFSTLYVVANSGNYYAKWDIDENGFIDHEEIAIDPLNSPSPQESITYKPYHCFLTPDEDKLFISCSETNEVRVFSTANDSLIATIPVGLFPRLMEYDTESDQLFIACAKQESFPDQGSMKGCVSVVNVSTMSFVQNIYRLGHRPHGLGVDAGRRRLYVSSENTGGIDPPHHALDGTGPPGKYNIVDLNTLQVLTEEETEVAVFPSSLVISE